VTEAAGVVNAEGRDNDAAFNGILASASPEVAALARAVRDLVYDVLPETVAVVWPRQGSIGWGTGPRKFTEQFAYLLPHKKHVTLGFYRGGELPDPEGLLPDSGGRQAGGSLSMRSLKIAKADQVGLPALRALRRHRRESGSRRRAADRGPTARRRALRRYTPPKPLRDTP
jgi:hypothetical protein